MTDVTPEQASRLGLKHDADELAMAVDYWEERGNENKARNARSLAEAISKQQCEKMGDVFHWSGNNLAQLWRFLKPYEYTALRDSTVTIFDEAGVELFVLLPGDRLERTADGLQMARGTLQ